MSISAVHPAPLTLGQTSDQLLSGTSPTQAAAPGAPAQTLPATTGQPVGGAGGGFLGAGGGGGFSVFLFPVVLVGAIILMQVFTSRREQKKRAALLGAIKKHDRVLTSGGIIGTVAEIRDDEIVVRVDENSNTKIRFTRASILQVIPAQSEAATAPGLEVKTPSAERVRT